MCDRYISISKLWNISNDILLDILGFQHSIIYLDVLCSKYYRFWIFMSRYPLREPHVGGPIQFVEPRGVMWWKLERYISSDKLLNILNDILFDISATWNVILYIMVLSCRHYRFWILMSKKLVCSIHSNKTITAS